MPLEILTTALKLDQDDSKNKTTFYAPTIKVFISPLNRYGTFLIDTGSMSSLLSSSLVDERTKLHKTGVNVTVANDEPLAVLGVTYLKLTMESESVQIPQENLFVVVDNEWTNYDGILGNDFLLQMDCSINMKERKIHHKHGITPIHMMKSSISDLILLPTAITTTTVDPEDEAVKYQLIGGQSIPANSTKMIRLRVLQEIPPCNKSHHNSCLYLPETCWNEAGCWSPECIVQVDKKRRIHH